MLGRFSRFGRGLLLPPYKSSINKSISKWTNWVEYVYCAESLSSRIVEATSGEIINIINWKPMKILWNHSIQSNCVEECDLPGNIINGICRFRYVYLIVPDTSYWNCIYELHLSTSSSFRLLFCSALLNTEIDSILEKSLRIDGLPTKKFYIY